MCFTKGSWSVTLHWSDPKHTGFTQPLPCHCSATMLAGDAVAPAGSWWGGRPGLGAEPYASPEAVGAQKAAAKRAILQVWTCQGLVGARRCARWALV